MRTSLRWSVLLALGLGMGTGVWAGPSTGGNNNNNSNTAGGLDSGTNRAEQEARAKKAADEALAKKVAARNAVYEHKLRALVIAQIKVEAAPARDVLKLIRDQAKEVDPDARGFNLLLTCKPALLDTPITMDMTSVPVPDLLHFVSLAAGFDLKYEEHAVVVIDRVAKN